MLAKHYNFCGVGNRNQRSILMENTQTQNSSQQAVVKREPSEVEIKQIEDAAFSGDVKLFQSYQANGINFKNASKWSEGLLELACRMRRLNVVEFLASHTDLLEKSTRASGQTVLQRAVINNDEALVDVLLKAGANPNASDKNNSTALHEAARFGSVSILKKLYDAGADLTSMNTVNETPADVAASYGCCGALLFFKAAGVISPELSGKRLEYMADRNNQTRARCFLEHLNSIEELTVDSVDEIIDNLYTSKSSYSLDLLGQETALFGDRNESMPEFSPQTAEQMRDLILPLLQNKSDAKDITAKKEALKANHQKVVNAQLWQAIGNGDIDRARRVLKLNADIHQVDEDGDGLAHLAVKNGHVNSLHWLDINGANLDLKDKEGDTPAHVGAALGQVHMLSYLIDKGCDVTSPNNQNLTPLDLASLCKKEKAEFVLMKATLPRIEFSVLQDIAENRFRNVIDRTVNVGLVNRIKRTPTLRVLNALHKSGILQKDEQVAAVLKETVERYMSQSVSKSKSAPALQAAHRAKVPQR